MSVSVALTLLRRLPLFFGDATQTWASQRQKYREHEKAMGSNQHHGIFTCQKMQFRNTYYTYIYMYIYLGFHLQELRFTNKLHEVVLLNFRWTQEFSDTILHVCTDALVGPGATENLERNWWFPSLLDLNDWESSPWTIVIHVPQRQTGRLSYIRIWTPLSVVSSSRF